MIAPDTSNWHIRLARPEDALAMPAIERAAGAMFARIEGFEWVAGQEPVPVDRLRRYIARGHCLVTTAGDTLVGFIATEPFGRELHIRELDVHPGWQGRGLGAALLRACFIDAGNTGFAAITLTTFAEVPWNAPFYRRMGFRDVAGTDHPRLAAELEREAAHGMPPGSRVGMIRELT